MESHVRVGENGGRGAMHVVKAIGICHRVKP